MGKRKKLTDLYKINETVYKQMKDTHQMFSRCYWDSSLKYSFKAFEKLKEKEVENIKRGRPRYTLKDYALERAAKHVDLTLRKNVHGVVRPPNLPEEIEKLVLTKKEAAKIVKKAAKLYGADLVGICKLDKKWVYNPDYPAFAGEWDDRYQRNIPENLKYVVVLVVAMDPELIKFTPSPLDASTSLGYSLASFAAASLADFISRLGYYSMSTVNEAALSIPLAVEAGLGELGRNGLLVTAKYGPAVRISKVFTDLPLKIDEPRKIGVKEFCEKCKKCAKYCPSQAISRGKPTWSGPVPESNNSGVLKWYINPDKCLSFWGKNGGQCSVCVRVCPWTKGKGRIHEIVRFIIKKTSFFNPLWVFFDDLLGYGKQESNPASFWEENFQRNELMHS